MSDAAAEQQQQEAAAAEQVRGDMRAGAWRACFVILSEGWGWGEGTRAAPKLIGGGGIAVRAMKSQGRQRLRWVRSCQGHGGANPMRSVVLMHTMHQMHNGVRVAIPWVCVFACCHVFFGGRGQGVLDAARWVWPEQMATAAVAAVARAVIDAAAAKAVVAGAEAAAADGCQNSGIMHAVHGHVLLVPCTNVYLLPLQ